MAKRDGWDRRSARRHLAAAQDAGPPSDRDIRNRYNEGVGWAIPLAEKRYAAYRRVANEEEQ